METIGCLVGVAALAVPSIFVILLELSAGTRARLAAAAYALTVLLYIAGIALHHDAFARSAIALAGALLFATAALLVFDPGWNETPAPASSTQLVRSLGWTLGGERRRAAWERWSWSACMSSPLTMEEIERFRGVRLILALPPLIALVLYLFDKRFGSGVDTTARRLSLAGTGVSAASPASSWSGSAR